MRKFFLLLPALLIACNTTSTDKKINKTKDIFTGKWVATNTPAIHTEMDTINIMLVDDNSTNIKSYNISEYYHGKLQTSHIYHLKGDSLIGGYQSFTYDKATDHLKAPLDTFSIDYKRD